MLRWLGVPLSLTTPGFWGDYLGTESFTGKTVGVDGALQLSTVWACVRLISETISTLPLGFYERQPDGSRRIASDHPLYEVLHNQPNADMTAVTFWEVAVASMLLWGNFYCEIVRSRSGIVALNFLIPERMTVRRLPDGSLEYRYLDVTGGAPRLIPENGLMHIPAFSTDGVIGLSPVSYARNVFGTAVATDRASASQFKDGLLKQSGIIRVDAMLKPEQRDDYRAHIAKVQANGGVYVLEKGVGFESLSFSAQDAELLQSRGFNIEEICRWFRIPPFMVGHSEKSTSWGTGIEQQQIGFVTFVLRPWLVRIEQGIRKSLLTPVERKKYFAEFSIEGLLRGDSTARAAFYASMVQNGNMTRDEVRGLENWPTKGGNADTLTVQSNMLPIDKLGEEPAATTAQDALKSFLGIDTLETVAAAQQAALKAKETP